MRDFKLSAVLTLLWLSSLLNGGETSPELAWYKDIPLHFLLLFLLLAVDNSLGFLLKGPSDSRC